LYTGFDFTERSVEIISFLIGTPPILMSLQASLFGDLALGLGAFDPRLGLAAFVIIGRGRVSTRVSIFGRWILVTPRIIDSSSIVILGFFLRISVFAYFSIEGLETTKRSSNVSVETTPGIGTGRGLAGRETFGLAGRDTLGLAGRDTLGLAGRDTLGLAGRETLGLAGLLNVADVFFSIPSVLIIVRNSVIRFVFPIFNISGYFLKFNKNELKLKIYIILKQ
jgi:hypothetical protein